MQDRVPLYPGRVKLTPVSGQENTYDMVRADEPTQEGTPLSKATFLKDATAALFGLDASAVPDDAFVSLINYALHGLYRYDLTIIIDGLPLANVEVAGLTAVDGSAVYTDANGKVTGFAGASTTVTFPKYADLTEFSFEVEKENMVTTKTLTGQRTIEVLTLSSSKSYRFSSHVDKVSICTVGGGGNGGGATYQENSSSYPDTGYGGGGGGGGYVSSLLAYAPVVNADYIFTVGAQSGASSCVLDNDVIVEAAGGAHASGRSGGAGNGNGGDGYNVWTPAPSSSGTDGTGYVFDDETYGAVGGGGGGGMGTRSGSSCSGGAPNGAKGGNSSDARYSGASASGYGGGGGGGIRYDKKNYGGGAGYPGAVLIRFDKYKEAV